MLLGLILAISLALSSAAPWRVAVENFDAPAAAAGEHPRLFFSSQDIPRLREEAATTHREIWQPILAFATSKLSASVPPQPQCPTLEDFRNDANQLVAFAFAYVITGDPQYFELTRRHLVAYATWEYWGDEGACGDVDLGHAHMLQGNAIAYDWIYNDLTVSDRALISENLARRAQQSYEASSAERYIMGNWWRRAYSQNHHWINHGALGIAALVLEGEDSRVTSWLDQAVSQLSRDRDLAEGIGDGSWHEGIPYQSYGLTMSLPFFYNLRRIKGPDILPHTYLQNYVYWRVYNSLPGTWHFALSHADFDWSWGNAYASQNIIRLAAREYRDGHAEWAAQHLVQYAGRAANVWSAPFCVFEFLYYDASVSPQPPDDLPPDHTFPDLEGVVWRTGWGAGDMTFALKTGPYSGRFAFERFLRGEYPFDHPGIDMLNNGHDHQDTNSFYLYWGGVDLASEAVVYGGTAARYHNTLLVDGEGQYEDPDTFNGYSYWDEDPALFRDADGKLERVVEGQSFSYLIADATNRYRRRDPVTGAPGERLVTEFKRHVLFDRSGYLVMADNIRASAVHRFEWVSHFGSAVSIEGDWIKEQAQDGKVLGVKVLSPSGFLVATGNDGKPYARIRPSTDVSSTRFVLVLLPMDSANWTTRPQVSSLSAAGGTVGVRVEINGTRDHLIRLEGQGFAQVGNYSFDGQAASILRGPDGQLGKVFLAGGSQLVDNNIARTLVQSSGGDPIVEIGYEGTGLRITGSGLGTLRLYAPEADPGLVTLNGQPAQASRQGDYIVVSEALVPTFADVPFDHPYHDEIEWLYRNGYTAGCGTDPLRYCPDATMNRAESAVFVEHGIHDTSTLPPQPTSQTFADLPLDSWAAKWAEALWQDHYTAGCGANPLVYCPWQGHTRAEGCVFYLHMLNGPTYAPPQPLQQTFADVPLEAWYAKWVQAAYDAGLITACQTSPELRFCPNDPLSRGLAAYMMVQAKHLPVLPPAGLYHACWPGNQSCLDELQVMHDGGFAYTINYSDFDYDIDTILAYANKLESLGMKTFWDMSRPTFAQGSVDPQYVIDRVNAVKGSSATAGYYVGDESNTTPTDVEWISSIVRQADPNPAHRTLFVHYYQIPDCTVMARAYSSPSVDALGLDLYAFANDRPSEDVSLCSKAGQEWDDAHDKDWVAVLQSFRGTDYGLSNDFPSRERMRLERDLALQNSRPLVVFWWWYRSAQETGHWDDLVWAANGG